MMMTANDDNSYMSLINLIRASPENSMMMLSGPPPPSVTPTNVQMPINRSQQYPRAILTCHENSHPFNNRVLDLSDRVKIGRAVNKCKTSNNNAIFDCKVLSRNHACIWYEDGKFYIQDTKSSNGTFVNKDRLSPANCESAPQEIFSNDVVQFGVDVTENNRKITHGCVVATLTLYHPSGEEVRRSASDMNSVNNNCSMRDSSMVDYSVANQSQLVASITTGQLLQLSSFLREALKREESLEMKIKSLEAIIEKSVNAAQGSWKGCVEEDRLLSRIEALQFKLESLLIAFSKKTDDETILSLKNEVIKLHDLKETYEFHAKESVLLAQETICSSKSVINSLEISLSSAIEENERITSLNNDLSSQLISLGEKYDSLTSDVEEMEMKLKRTEELLKTQESEFDAEKFHLSSGYETQIKLLNDKIESLDFEIVRLKSLLDETELQLDNQNILNTSLSNKLGPLPSLVIDGNSNRSEVSNNGQDEIITNGELEESNHILIAEQTTQSKNESNLQLSSSPTPSSPSNASQLRSEVKLLKELLKETRNAKQDAELRVHELECEQKRLENEVFHAKEDLKRSAAEIVQAKCKIEASNKTVDTLLKELNNVQGQLKLSHDEVNTLHQTLNREKMKVSSNISSTLMSPPSNDETSVLSNRISDLMVELSSARSQLDSLKEINEHLKSKTDTIDGEPRTLLSEQELVEKETELLVIRDKYDEMQAKSKKLEEQISLLKDDLELANYQNKIAFTCASVPLLMLILAIFAAFYPFVSSLTGTLES